MLEIQSKLLGIAWPGIPADRGCQLITLLFQLEQSQWWPAREIEEHQLSQVRSLFAHARATSSFYSRRLAEYDPTDGFPRDLAEFRKLPILKRRDLQEHGAEIRSSKSDVHGPASANLTTGSTGSPVQVWHTGFTRLFNDALLLRQHLWYKRDLRLKLAAIRYLEQAGEDSKSLPAWGAGAFGIIATGPSVVFNIQMPVAVQAQWLVREDPDYLLTYPTNLFELLRHFRDNGLQLPRLREVRTIGETLEPHVRQACRDVWRVPVVDSYSSVEIGSIATHCPGGDGYHIHAEHVIVEILNEAGEPCPPGEPGRIVVTDLHNFATPLIRYEIGDYGIAGPRCACGRGLPVLSAVLGRTRNMAILPNGRRLWPALQLNPGELETASQLPVRQYQLIQKSLTNLELKLVVTRPLEEVEEWMVRQWVEGAMGHPFEIEICYVDSIPRAAGGKYEEFRCEVTP